MNDLVPYPGHEIRAPTPESVDLVGAWLDGRADTTRRAYAGDLDDFARHVGEPDAAAACRAFFDLPGPHAHGVALAWRAAMVERKLSPATIARRLSALKSINRLARVLGRCDWTLEVEGPTVTTYRDTRGPGDEGWAAMLALAESEAADGQPVKLRNLAIIRLLHDLALRRRECARIRAEDVEFGSAGRPESLWIFGKGRGNQSERLTVPAPTARALACWLDARGLQAGPLFPRLDNAAGGAVRPISGGAIWDVVLDLGRRAGLTRRVTPHQLRHAAITRASDRTNGDVVKVAAFSRHRDLRTVRRYIDNLRDAAGEVAALVAE